MNCTQNLFKSGDSIDRAAVRCNFVTKAKHKERKMFFSEIYFLIGDDYSAALSNLLELFSICTLVAGGLCLINLCLPFCDVGVCH